MSFDPEQLKRIALAKREEIKKAFKVVEPTPVNLFTPEEVSTICDDIQSSVVEYAAEGELCFPYQFLENHSVSFIYAVADEFKLRHPRLMSIISEGERKLTIVWDGKNHV